MSVLPPFVHFALSETAPHSFPNSCVGALPCLGAGPHGLVGATFSANEKLKSGSLIHRGTRYDPKNSKRVAGTMINYAMPWDASGHSYMCSPLE